MGLDLVLDEFLLRRTKQDSTPELPNFFTEYFYWPNSRWVPLRNTFLFLLNFLRVSSFILLSHILITFNPTQALEGLEGFSLTFFGHFPFYLPLSTVWTTVYQESIKNLPVLYRLSLLLYKLLGCFCLVSPAVTIPNLSTTFVIFLLSRAVKHWQHFGQETLDKNKLNGIYMNSASTFVLGAYAQKLKYLISSDLSSSSNLCVGTKEHQEGVTGTLFIVFSWFLNRLHYPLPQRGRQSHSVMLFFQKDKSETARVCCEADRKIFSVLVSVLPGIARPG